MRSNTILLTGRVKLFLNIVYRGSVHFSWEVTRLAVVNEGFERPVQRSVTEDVPPKPQTYPMNGEMR